MAFTAVLLAGGESRRMRRDKGTLVWRGRPLWKLQIEKLRKLRPEKILIAARSDPSWRPADIDLALDDPPSRGPVSGLTAALERTETEHLLVLAVDMPFMTVEHLRNLCEQAVPGMGVISVADDRTEPLAAIYPKEVSARFRQALSGADFSLQPIIQNLIALSSLRVMQISGADRDLYKSVNEPRDVD